MRWFFCVLAYLLSAEAIIGQEKYNLVDLQNDGNLAIINRKLSVEKDGGGSFLRLSQDKGEGLVLLPASNFKEGSISVLLRGKNINQQSFIGLAFNIQNDSTFEAVYCRPFNFFATDSVRKIHAIQYVSHPAHPWKTLREKENAVFEKEIVNPPNPDNWFKLTLRIRQDSVFAYINDASKPALKVTRLQLTGNGQIGLFVANNSGGDFRYVEISGVNKIN